MRKFIGDCRSVSPKPKIKLFEQYLLQDSTLLRSQVIGCSHNNHASNFKTENSPLKNRRNSDKCNCVKIRCRSSINFARNYNLRR